VASNIVKEAPYLLRITLRAIFRVIFRAPSRAAMPVIYMAASKDFEGKTGEYLHMFKPKKMDPKVYDEEEGKKLWDRSQSIWKSVDPGAMTITPA
jgi:hypothetical protein